MRKGHRGGEKPLSHQERFGDGEMTPSITEPLWEFTGAYQKPLASFAKHDQVKGPWIACVAFSRDTLTQAFPNYADFIPPAFTIGGVAPLWLKSLSMPVEYLNRPIGAIVIQKDLHQSFTVAEMKYIVAHEYSHILKNHWPMARLGPVLGDIAGGIIAGMQDANQRVALTGILQSVRELAGALFTRQSEIDADAHALRLIGSKPIAGRTIRKLADVVADSDLDAPTHYAFVNGMHVGVLTFRERLNCISAAQ